MQAVHPHMSSMQSTGLTGSVRVVGPANGHGRSSGFAGNVRAPVSKPTAASGYDALTGSTCVLVSTCGPRGSSQVRRSCSTRVPASQPMVASGYQTLMGSTRGLVSTRGPVGSSQTYVRSNAVPGQSIGMSGRVGMPVAQYMGKGGYDPLMGSTRVVASAGGLMGGSQLYCRKSGHGQSTALKGSLLVGQSSALTGNSDVPADVPSSGHGESTLPMGSSHLHVPSSADVASSETPAATVASPVTIEAAPVPAPAQANQAGNVPDVPLISLGCFCGPKLSFQQMGFGAATLPFDWLCTNFDGVTDMLRNDFDGFFDYETKEPMEQITASKFLYRAKTHSFCHDDPDDPETREKYTRRIHRLLDMKDTGPLLFVRAIFETDELLHAGELMDLITSKFGKQGCLLLVVDFQREVGGPFVVQGFNDLLVYFLKCGTHKGNKAPYQEPVECALSWARGDPLQAPVIDSLSHLYAMAEEYGYDKDLSPMRPREGDQVPRARAGARYAPKVATNERIVHVPRPVIQYVERIEYV
eukprot:gnl/TRDRNA2_/TRDRNA2_60800_c0_seq1.p1 gnl/TRDRNA2_/TRDRNA2_60800_c0~~gnl/TRDRNA2_/TRDRNA2_60800_c0_seq1.p1  ORF type:complete len:543 (+),score=37.85 gnl/TRDRNA2_/TRDRNA2_60800_c0_seq1:49-1629(+)